MRRLLLSLWDLPWPPRLRRLFEPLLMFGPVQQLVVPHFRCGVVGIVRNSSGEYLVFKHTYRSGHPWGLPTGFMEHGEQPADALQREIGEESGLQVEVGSVRAVYTDARSIVNIVFTGRARSDEFTASAEISEARFCPLSALPPISPEQRCLLETYGEEDDHQEPA